MVKTIDRQVLKKIEDAVGRHGADGATASQIAAALDPAPPPRTLQFRLKHLVDQRRLIREGVRRGARYRLPPIAEAVGIAVGTSQAEAIGEAIVLPLSKQAATIQQYVRQPLAARRPVGYDRGVQGNMDSTVLFAPRAVALKHAQRVLDDAGGRPGHIFNLGHGILPETPVETVQAVVDYVHEASAKKK